MKRPINLGKTAILMQLFGMVMLMSACSYQKIGVADFPAPSLYMTTAANATRAPSANGIYAISSLSVPNQVSRYVIDLAARRFSVPLGIGRSGVDINGALSVNLGFNTDTVATLKAAGVLPADTDLLLADKVTMPRVTTMASGATSVTFPVTVDLDYLISTPNRKFALAVRASGTTVPVRPSLSTTIVLIDTKFLFPTADFTSSVDASSTKKINFTNTSLNGVSYVWDFGDSTPTVTDTAPSHTYAAAGTYAVTLTTTGILGNTGMAKKTVTLKVL